MARRQKKEYSPEQKAQFRAEAKAKMDAYTKDLGQKVLDLIKSGQGTQDKWQKDWRGGSTWPQNPVSNHRFQGGNMMALTLYMMFSGLDDPRFCTYAQAKKLGEDTHVRKGSEGFTILRPMTITIEDEEDAEERILDGGTSDSEGERRIVIYKPHKVFHASQIENMPALHEVQKVDWEQPLIESLLPASGVQYIHSGQVPGYGIDNDLIVMPEKGMFDSKEAYYATLLHEWYHATGHADRENREMGSNQPGATDAEKEAYQREELRAEAFSALACHMLGLPYSLANNAAYLDRWSQDLEDSPKSIMSAAVEASRMLETVMNFRDLQQPKEAWFPDKSLWPTAGPSSEEQALGDVAEAGDDFDPFAALEEREDAYAGPGM